MPKIPTIGLRAASQSLAATLTTIVGSAAGDNADSTTGAIALGSLSLARLVCQYTRHASSTTGAPVFAVDVSMDAPDTAAMVRAGGPASSPPPTTDTVTWRS